MLYVLMPELPTEDAFFGQVFNALGTPTITYRATMRRRDAAFRLLRERGTRALVIDEINSGSRHTTGAGFTLTAELPEKAGGILAVARSAA